MDENKQQIVERIKQATNILVTVSANPSVDQLAACIGLTLLLNKMDKHATAVFSGEVPSTIEFLKPETTLEQDTNSLRDFIISLDKAKADHLRYKVEESVVKIFITPYRTSLSSDDLNFSQGDFNVELVVALGVHEREDLDKAIVAHGRILHDATVVSINTTSAGALGTVNWNDVSVSSLSEMTTSMVDSLKPDILDSQIATALLTGIVAETDRFSNARTTPQTMTLASKLMAAGANQQLIATSLAQPIAVPSEQAPPAAAAPLEEPPKEADGTLSIDHSDSSKDKEPELDYSNHDEIKADIPDIHIDPEGNFSISKVAAEQAIASVESPKEPVVEESDNGFRPDKREYLTEDSSTKAEVTNADIDTDGPSALEEPGQLAHIDAILSHDSPAQADEVKTEPSPVETQKTADYIETPVKIAVAPVAAPQAEAALISDLPPIVEQKAIEPAVAQPVSLPIVPSEPPVVAPVVAPLPPEIDVSPTTLSDIEQAVEAHHMLPPVPKSTLQAGSSQPPPMLLDENDARSAVMNAIASDPTPDQVLEPVKKLNSQPLGESLHPNPELLQTVPTPIAEILAHADAAHQQQNTVGQVIDPTAPPAVAPPIFIPPPPPIPYPQDAPVNSGNPLFKPQQ